MKNKSKLVQKSNIKKLVASLFGTIGYFMQKQVFATTYHISDKVQPSYIFAKDSIATVLAVIRYVCIAVVIAWWMIIGLQFMQSSPDAKAEIKKKMVAAVIGTVIIFSVTAIITIVSQIKF